MDDSGLDIGTLLKERREQLGYSLKDVSERIRIRRVYLESIEANNFSDLPGRVYVTGFIDVYSRYLGLDNKEILSSLNSSDIPEASNVGSVPLPEKFEQKFNSAPLERRKGKFLWVFMIVLVIGLAFILFQSFFDNDSPEIGKQSISKKAAEPPVKDTVESREEEPSGRKVEPSEGIGAASVAKETDVTAVEKVVLKPLPVISAEGSSLRMLALGDGSLIINVDNRKPFNYRLHNGLDLTWTIKSRVSVKMNPADVVRFWLDGQELDISGLTTFQLSSADEG